MGWEGIMNPIVLASDGMTMSPEAAQPRCFTRDYELGRSEALRDLERDVLGCNFATTSWTTRDEARAVVDLVALRSQMRLLDVGAGYPLKHRNRGERCTRTHR
jgi:hypothetical protein